MDKIENLNARTSFLIGQITNKIGLIQEAITSRTIPADQLEPLKEALKTYIKAVEPAADKQPDLTRINEELDGILARIQGVEGQRRGGGRRTKKHKKSKSKGKGKATKSNGRKTRRGRSGKAKKSRSRKHTSKRR